MQQCRVLLVLSPETNIFITFQVANFIYILQLFTSQTIFIIFISSKLTTKLQSTIIRYVLISVKPVIEAEISYDFCSLSLIYVF